MPYGTQPETISIHALREEGDALAAHAVAVRLIFLSTPSARRATGPVHLLRVGRVISIHALREEGDDQQVLKVRKAEHFYPRPPRGGRRKPRVDTGGG